MSLSTRIKGLESRLKRLEVAAGKGQKCAYCRLILRNSWPDPRQPKPKPEDVIKTKCEFCNTEFTVPLYNSTEEEREEFRLYHSFTTEDQYTYPKAHALMLWVGYKQALKKDKDPAKAVGKASDQKKGISLHDKLMEASNNLASQKHKKLRAKYGVDPFPEHRTLIESVSPKHREKSVFINGLFDLERDETNYLICAELEKIIWGEVRPSTAAALEKIDKEINELIRAAEEKDRQRKEQELLRKEEARISNLQFLNRNRAKSGLPPLPDDYGKSS